MHTHLKRAAAGAALSVSLLLAAVPGRAAVIVNGGFESGLAGWTRVDQPGSDGGFMPQSGTTSPVTATTVPAPPGGGNAAMTDAEGPGSHLLYQDFTQAAPVGSAILSFDLFIGNRADAFHVPATLDFSTPALNQQARVDILRAGADPFSLAPADILANLFATPIGSPLVSGYQHVEIDLTGLLNANLNATLRLRFAEVDNVNLFQFGVDNVVLETDGRPVDVPEPATWWLVAGGAAALAQRRRSRR